MAANVTVTVGRFAGEVSDVRLNRRADCREGEGQYPYLVPAVGCSEEQAYMCI